MQIRRDTTMAAAIEAIFASVNPNVAKGEDLRRNIATSLSETRRLRNPNIALQKAVYKGIATLFEGLTKSKSGADGSDAAAAAGDGGSVVEDLKEHLFRADAGSEAVRLLRADGAVVSSEELLERVWDENADPFTTTVRVTVMTLRKKLGEPQVVHTVVGAGYRVGES